MNIYDVSAKAGVSIATVSRVLNGNSNVSEKTKQKVLSVMEELGYTPNVFARGLGLNTMQTIGIMCTDSSDTYLANAVYYLERELRANNYDSILCCTGDNMDNKKKYLELLLSKRVDAVILAGSKFVSPQRSENRYILQAARQVPIILVNGYLKGSNIYSVVCDDKMAVYQTAVQLIKSGCRNPVYLYTSSSYSGTNKLSGFISALKDNRIGLDERRIHLCDKTISSARDYLNHLCRNQIAIDGVMASDDSLAVGAVKYAYEHGIPVPGSLQIVGYNNSILASCTEPELTSIDSRVEDLCIQAVQSLMQVFNSQAIPAQQVIPAALIKRNTTKF